MATFLNIPRADRRYYVVVALAALILILSTLLSAPTNDIPLSIYNVDRDGAMALREWFERSGYEIVTVSDWDQLEENAVEVLFILYPLTEFDRDEIDLLDRWLRQGHTLIVGGDPFTLNPLLEKFQLSLRALSVSASPVVVNAPTLLNPAPDRIEGIPFSEIQILADAEVAVHRSIGGNAVVVSEEVGRGRLWVVSILRSFTNLGLREAGSGSLIANLLAGVPAGAVIAFDEGSHGINDNTRSLNSWLYNTAPGLGVLSAFGLTLLFLASRGRRFGQPIPLPEHRQRRESVEYVQAIAGLFRRSGDRREVQQHYEQQLRRALAARYAVDPTLNAGELLRAVNYRSAAVDVAELRGLLIALGKQHISETELVALVARLDEFLKGLP
ncbi:MAG: DUF4350 domain-containing protein [Anaerolineae bacterium]